MLRAKIHSLESDPMAPGGAVSPRAPTSTAVAPLQRQHSFAAHKAISPVTFALNKYWLLVEMLPMVAVCVVIRVIIEQAIAEWVATRDSKFDSIRTHAASACVELTLRPICYWQLFVQLEGFVFYQ